MAAQTGTSWSLVERVALGVHGRRQSVCVKDKSLPLNVAVQAPKTTSGHRDQTWVEEAYEGVHPSDGAQVHLSSIQK